MEDTISSSRSTEQIVKESQSSTDLRNGNRLRDYFTIDLRMLPSKMSYLFFYGGQGCYMTFFNVFFTSLGLTPTQAGLITGLRAVPAFIGAPLWGLLADYTGQRKILMLILSIMHLCLIFTMPWVAKHVNDFDLGKTFHNTSSYNQSMYESTPVNLKYCTTECNDNTMFYSMMAVMFASGFLELSVCSFIDSFVINLVESSTKKTNFGRQRVFGALGFASSSFLAGFAADHYRDDYLSNYTAVFFVFLPFFLLFIPTSYYVASKAEVRNENHDGKKESLVKPILQTCGKFSNIIFLFTVLLSGVCLGTVLGFIFLYMEDEMNSSKTAMGLSIVIGNIGEVLMFPISHKIIKTVGTEPCIISGVFSYFLRFLLMSWARNQWLMLPIQLLHAFGFALFFAAAIEHVEKISPKEICTTMISLLNGLKFGVGILVANMAGGAAYDKFGGRTLFLGMSFICLGWSVVLVFYYYGTVLFDRMRHKLTSKSDEKVEEL